MKGVSNNLKQLKMDTVSPATRLLDKRRLMYQVQEAFERQKEEEARRLEMFNNKEEELRARDLAVQEKFVEFSKVINENEAKLQRAKNRINEEKNGISAKEAKKKELQDKVAEQKEKVMMLEKSVQAMKEYEDFLELVRAKNPEEFTDINDILSLYEKLSKENNNLKNKQKELEEENQRKRHTKDHLEKKKKIEILKMNIEIAQRSKEFEEIDNRRQNLTKDVEQSSAIAVSRQVEIGHIFMAVDNLYARCCDGPKINHNGDLKPLPPSKADEIPAKSNEVMEKLHIIKAYLNDFRALIQRAPTNLIMNSKAAKEINRLISKESNNS